MVLARKRKASSAHARGFSAVEMAVAVIILGVGMTMALKGTVMIEIFRAFIASYELETYQRWVQLYAVQYKYLPGDDPKAPGRFERPPATWVEDGRVLSSPGDSRLDGKLSDTDNPLGEQYMAWRDLRYSRLLDGDPKWTGADAMPRNPFGGVYGFDEGNLGQKAGSICLTNVSGGGAKRLDESMDDGIINRGDVVATSKYDPQGAKNHFDVPDSTPYDVEKTYIICAPLRP